MAEEVKSKKTTTRKPRAKKEVEETTTTPVVEEKAAKKALKKEAKAAKKAEKEEKKVSKKVKEEKPLPNPVSEAKAVAKNIRCTPRKARLVIDLVRGKSVNDAVAILKNLRKDAALPVLKVIQSAASNAINNFNLDDEKLYIKEIYASDGMRMKRYLPRAKGSASGLVKRMCHITCVVKEKK